MKKTGAQTMETTIHKVKNVTVQREKYNDFHYLEMTLYTEKGETVKIQLFSEDYLNISVPRKEEDKRD